VLRGNTEEIELTFYECLYVVIYCMYHSLSLGQREETSSVWQSGGYYHIKSYHNIPVWLCLTVTRMPSISLSSLPSGPLSLSLRLSFPLVRYELRVWWIPYHWCVMGWEPMASSNLKCSLFFYH